MKGITPFMVFVIIIAVFVGGGVYSFVSDIGRGIESFIEGPESCWTDDAATRYAIGVSGFTGSYEKQDTNQLCVRTRDSSLVQNIDKYRQDKLAEIALAQIQADAQKSWLEKNALLLFIIAIIILVLVFDPFGWR